MQLCNSTGINTKVPLNTISMLFILRVYFLNIFTRPGLWCDRVHLSPGDSEFFHHKLLSYQHWPIDLPSDINHFQSLNPFKRTWLCKQTLYNGTIHIFFPPLPPQKLLWETILHLINFPNMQWFFFSPLNFWISNLDQKKHSKNGYHLKEGISRPTRDDASFLNNNNPFHYGERVVIITSNQQKAPKLSKELFSEQSVLEVCTYRVEPRNTYFGKCPPGDGDILTWLGTLSLHHNMVPSLPIPYFDKRNTQQLS